MATPTRAYGKSGVTYYEMSDGSTVRADGGTINLRNNNPGNIRYGSYAKSMGAIGESNGFAIFPDMQAGQNAQVSLLKSKSYQNAPARGGYPEGSVGAAIYKWAPPSENDSGNYVRQVEKKMGVSANTQMKDLTPAQLEGMRQAMANHEGSGSPKYSEMGKLSESQKAEIQSNIKQAQIPSPTKTYLSSNYVSRDNVGELLANTTASEFITNGKFYEGNVLDDYDNPTYHLKFWMISVQDFEEYTQLVDSEDRRNFIYRPDVYKRSVLIYESGVTTEWGITDVSIDSTIGMDVKTRKTRVSQITMDILEPNGCKLFDRMEQMSQRLGWVSKQHQPYFLEISFVGYKRMDVDNGGNQMVIQYTYRDETGATRVRDLRQLYCIQISDIQAKFSPFGFQYKMTGTPLDHMAYNKDFYNTKGVIEYDRGVLKLRDFLQVLEDKMNEHVAKGSGKQLIAEGIMSDKDFFKFTYRGEDDPKINLSVIASAGESANKSAKFRIATGKSVAQIIDQLSKVLELENAEGVTTTDVNGATVYQKFPKLLQVESKIRYKGQSPKTGQKAFSVEYIVQPYYMSRLKWNNCKDWETIARYTIEQMYSNGFVFKKRYDYVFTSKNFHIINLDFNIDCLWQTKAFTEASENYNDTNGNIITPPKSYPIDNMSRVDGTTRQYTDYMGIKGLDFPPEQNKVMNNQTNITWGTTPQMTTVAEAQAKMSAYNQASLEELNSGAVIDSLKLDNAKLYTGVNTFVAEADNVYVEHDFTPDNNNKSELKNESIFSQLYDCGNAVELKMTIRGDPYWLVEDMDGTYHGENSIYFTMKTPSVRKDDDMANDNFGAGVEDIHTLSGVYNVVSIKHKFSRGVFTQEMHAVLNGNFRFPI